MTSSTNGGRGGGKTWSLLQWIMQSKPEPDPADMDQALHDRLLPAIVRNCVDVRPGRHMPGTYELALAAGRKAIQEGRPWDATNEAFRVMDARDMSRLCLCGHFHPPVDREAVFRHVPWSV
jgi:hypothetical protein